MGRGWGGVEGADLGLPCPFLFTVKISLRAQQWLQKTFPSIIKPQKRNLEFFSTLVGAGGQTEGGTYTTSGISVTEENMLLWAGGEGGGEGEFARKRPSRPGGTRRFCDIRDKMEII